MSPLWPFRLFEATGVELEYMIVDSGTLDVKPIADELLRTQSGSYESEVEIGDLAWSNELALHAIEIKTNGPVASLAGLAGRLQEHVSMMNGLLAPMGARLMPTAMHPWMDPHAELRLWPHEHNPVYEAFDRIFDCRGHGWANLQSTHINLPFADGEEFGRLHAAVRLVLPIVPALAAASPVADGRPSGLLDTRLDVYRTNAIRIPSVTADMIPEPVFTPGDYEERILQRIYGDLAPHDPEGTLRNEWVNARGCIARFDRGSIEIRVIDVQECPAADIAVAEAVIAVVRALADGTLASFEDQTRWPVAPLASILRDTTRLADMAIIEDADYLAMLGLSDRPRAAAGDLWRHLIAVTLDRGAIDPEVAAALDVVLDEGPLARRILAALGLAPGRDRLKRTYADLCACLARGSMFRAPR